MPILAFRNNSQVALFKYELAGQISDGMWENARPYDHYKPWCHCEVIVDPVNVGKDFYAQRESYNFSSRDLLDVVGERMVYKARLAEVMGHDILKYINWKIESGVLRVPEKPEGKTAYYTEEYDAIMALPIERINAVLADTSVYTMKHLRKDLTDMKRIIKMRRA
jgi:hypothetical protein